MNGNSGAYPNFFCSDSLTYIPCSCLAHVVSLAVEAFMAGVTQIAIALSREAIWDFDPASDENQLGTGIDVIAALRTLTVKVRYVLLQLCRHANSDLV